RNLVEVDVRNRSESLQNQVRAFRSRIRQGQGGVLADLLLHRHVPLLHIREWIAGLARDNQLAVKEVWSGGIPRGLIDAEWQRVGYGGQYGIRASRLYPERVLNRRACRIDGREVRPVLAE